VGPRRIEIGSGGAAGGDRAPADTWKPVDNNTGVGTYTPGQMIVTGISGVRSFRLSARFNF
jgi:hypothetical protein